MPSTLFQEISDFICPQWMPRFKSEVKLSSALSGDPQSRKRQGQRPLTVTLWRAHAATIGHLSTRNGRRVYTSICNIREAMVARTGWCPARTRADIAMHLFSPSSLLSFAFPTFVFTSCEKHLHRVSSSSGSIAQSFAVGCLSHFAVGYLPPQAFWSVRRRRKESFQVLEDMLAVVRGRAH
jgi:hypothetical protein